MRKKSMQIFACKKNKLSIQKKSYKIFCAVFASASYRTHTNATIVPACLIKSALKNGYLVCKVKIRIQNAPVDVVANHFSLKKQIM